MRIPSLPTSPFHTLVRGCGALCSAVYSQCGSKVGRVALSVLPATAAIWIKYEIASYVLRAVGKNTLKYSLQKVNGFKKQGTTIQKVSYYFHGVSNSALMNQWDISSFNYNIYSKEDVLSILEEATSLPGDPETVQLRAMQIFLKQLIGKCFDQLELGFEVRLPVLDENKNLEFVTYTLDQEFDVGDGIPAFGFVDKENKHPPLLGFRCTNYHLQYRDALPALIANFHPKGSAWKLYRNSEEEIENWLIDKTQNGKNKARILGYSQGGTLASYYAVYKSEWISQKEHEPSIILDAPGVFHKVAEDWNALEEKPYVLTYLQKGDLFPKVGVQPIGKAYQVDIGRQLAPLQAHQALSMLAPQWIIQEVNIEKEKKSRTRHLVSCIQQGAGQSLYGFFRDYVEPSISQFLY